jgi:Uma2 family endonuclease
MLQTMTADEYLHTSWEHDPDFVEGEILERFGTTSDHGSLQTSLICELANLQVEGGYKTLVELTIHTAPERYRVADVCLLRATAPYEKITETPPLLCVEILAEEDQLRRALDRIRDFLRMGVPEVWVFDPSSRTVQICQGDKIIEHARDELIVPGTQVSIKASKIFADLDR